MALTHEIAGESTARFVGSDVFCSPEIYRLELDRVFTRTWLLVGHESLVPEPGDYVTNFMGEDPVVVARARDGRIHVYLNRCTHRGNKLCMFERGKASSFTCSFHGWTFRSDGTLHAVPARERYGDDFDQSAWGLVSARVGEHAGFVFATWDENGPSLEDFLGDFRPYLDVLGETHLDGVEVLPGKQRFMVEANWKLLAENFAGDHYHVPSTHISLFRVTDHPLFVDDAASHDPRRYAVTTGSNGAAAHSLLGSTPREGHDRDLRALAEQVGSDAVEWLEDYTGRADQSDAKHLIADIGMNSVGTIFPNASWSGVGSVGRLLQQFHPRGPRLTECWAWALMPKKAPDELKRLVVRMMSRRGTPAGMIFPDDLENFARINDALCSTVSRKTPLNYELGMDDSGAPEEFEMQGLGYLPGDVSVKWAVTEQNQRSFYAYWHKLMAGGIR